MEGCITWVGIDAHKATLAVAVLGHEGGKTEQFTIDNNEASLRKLARRLKKSGREVRACYEAGTCGFTLQRRLEAEGVVCDVIAPSLIPRKNGERIKTDRRDALKLAELLRANLLTAVSAPSPEQEAIRDLCRCREAVRADVGRCRHRLVKMLVRRGYVFAVKQRLWTVAHRRWLEELTFDNETDRVVVAELKLAIEQSERRLRELDKEIEKAAQLPLYREHIAWLRCFRGIDTLIAMVIVAELHGVERFESPRSLSAYLGLVPSLYATGDSAQRGSITKTGNRFVRRVLVQASWQYRRRKGLGTSLRKRREDQPQRVLTIAENADRRLTARYARLTARQKNPNKVVIAVARELIGFVWAALRDDRELARHAARNSAQLEGAKPTVAPRSLPLRKTTSGSKTEVGPCRPARQEKRANKA